MRLIKSKTFWAAIVQFLIAVVAFFSGDIDLRILIGDFVAMLLLIFYRDAMGTNLKNWLDGFFEKIDFLKDGVFWTVLVSILGSITAWLTGALEFWQMLLTVVTALVAFFMRAAATPENST